MYRAVIFLIVFLLILLTIERLKIMRFPHHLKLNIGTDNVRDKLKVSQSTRDWAKKKKNHPEDVFIFLKCIQNIVLFFERYSLLENECILSVHRKEFHVDISIHVCMHVI